jgi:Xaa-Pro aminopeptidase
LSSDTLLSTGELLRTRWREIGELIEVSGLRALLVGGHGTLHRYGNVEYLAGYCPWQQDAYVLLAPKRQPVLIVATRGDGEEVRRRGGADFYCPAASQGGLVPAVAEFLGAWGVADGPVGLVGREIIPAGDLAALGKHLPRVELRDATRMLAELKAVKSGDELRHISKVAALADEGLRAFGSALRMGADSREICADVERALRAGGARETIVRLGSGPYFNAPSRPGPVHPGQLLSAYVEVLGDNGYWVEMMRLVAVGELDAESARLMRACLDVASVAERSLCEGMRDTDCLDAIRDSALASGFRLDGGSAHGVGMDDADLPRFMASNPAPLKAGMVVAAHPRLVDDRREVGAVVGDTYVVSSSGPVRLSRHEERVLWVQ